MGARSESMSEQHRQFIEQQKLFFVATAAEEGRVNLSPKGMDSLRVLSEKRVIWLNVTGSGNETAAHVRKNPRMTLMFAAFEGAPLILRLYGKARVCHPYDPDWETLSAMLPELPGARQIFDLEVDLVQNSCGMAVPFFNYEGERGQLSSWAEKQGQEGIEAYWHKKNQRSLDDFPTAVLSPES